MRPVKKRLIQIDPKATYFKPRAVPLFELEEVILERYEIETLRLCDLKDQCQTEAAKKMGVSQSTLQRNLCIARRKIADALIHGKAIRINEKNEE